MRKVDYEILAAAIKKHREAAPGEYKNADQVVGAQKACDKIAYTFAQSAHVKKEDFLRACGLES